MTSAALNQVIDSIRSLPPGEIQQAYALLAEEFVKSLGTNGDETAGSKQVKPAGLDFGWARDLVTIAPDFDAALEDFEDYME